MTVEVVMLGRAGGAGATRFQDTLMSPDQPFAFGDNWAAMQNLVPLGSPYAGTDVASAVNRGATGTSLRNPGGGGFAPVVWAAPIPIDWSFCFTKNQYSQFQFISTSAGINRTCVCCFLNPNSGGVYVLQLITESSQFSIDRINNTVQTNLVAPSVTTAYVANDTLRLEVDVTTTPGTTIVRGKKNGVTVATVNDNAASRLTQGMFGYGMVGSNPAVTCVVANYDGGILR